MMYAILHHTVPADTLPYHTLGPIGLKGVISLASISDGTCCCWEKKHISLPKLQKKARLPPPAVHLQRDQDEDEVQEVMHTSVKSEPMGQATEGGEFQEQEEGAMVVAGYGDDYGEYGEEYNGQVYGGGVDPTTDNRGEI